MTLGEMVQVLFCIIAVKAMVIGSEFNFSHLIKHREKYWGWYNNRETFKKFLTKS